MSKQKNMGVNAILNLIKQGLSVIFPLITYPYALRVLGPESIGKVGYGQSIVTYFMLFAALGMSNYSVREGAKKKKNKEEFEKFANEVFSINVIFTLLSYALLFIALLFVTKLKEYRLLILLQSISILFSTLGIDWVNVIFEDYLVVTIRSIFTHLVSMVLLFLLIHTPEDYLIYALLTVITNGIVCVWNFFYCRKYVHIRPIFRCNFCEHIKPMLILFANSVAVTIYINLDTTMLGWIKGDYYVGLYSIDVKIYSIVKNLLAAIYVVSIPRFASLLGENDFLGYKRLYSRMWRSMSLILLPAGVGIMCISEELLYVLGGAEYTESSLTLRILAGALVFAVYGGLVTGCYNIVNGFEKRNLTATVISALLNMLLNMVAIPFWAQNGAALTTLLSEGFVMIFCFARIENKNSIFDFPSIKSSIMHALLGCLGVLLFTSLWKWLIDSIYLRFLCIIMSSIIGYIVILFMVKDELFVETFLLIKKKIIRKR